MDVRAWTIGIMCPSDALRDIDVLGTLDDTVSYMKSVDTIYDDIFY